MVFNRKYKCNRFYILLCIVLIWHISCAQNPEIRLKEQINKGNSSFTNRDYKNALVFWEEALKIQPTSIEVLKKKAQTYLHLAEFSKAEKIFTQIIKIQPEAVDIFLELTKLHLVTGDINSAVNYWEKLNSKHPKNQHVKALYGDFMIIKGRFHEAENAYENAIKISPNNEIILIKLAASYLSQDKIDKAQQTFEIATANKTDSTDALLQIANYWKLKGDMNNAELSIRKAILLDPEDLSLQMVLSRFYFNTKRYQDSRRIIEKLIKQAPENRSIKKYRIKILLAQNQLETIPFLLEKYKTEMKNDPEFNLLAGKYYLSINNPLIAEEYFKRVTRENSDYFLAHYLLGVTYILSGKVYLAQHSLIKSLSLNPLFSETELALADIYYKKNEFDFSHEHIKRVLAREPENFRAHLIMGNVLLAKKQYNGALTWFRSALSIKPNSEPAIYYIALASEHLKKKKKALELYQVLLKKNPNLVNVALKLKDLLIETGKIDIARQYFELAVDNSPENGYLYYILGEVCLAFGDTSKAIGCFNSTIELLPGLTSSYIKLAEIYGQKNNWEKQLDNLKLCLKNVPDFLDCYIDLAELYRQNGKEEQAIKILETGVSNNPDSALLANNLAYLYLEKDENINEAFELARFAYEHMPEDPAVVDSFGWAYYKKNFFIQSIPYLKNACILSPKNPISQYHLGQAQLSAGQEDEGRLSLKQAISLKLPSPYLEKAESFFK